MIIFYEDEAYYLEDKFEHLKENGFDLIIFDRADELLKYYKDNILSIDCIVIDIMVFGPGNDFDKFSDDGLISGHILIDELEKIEKSFEIELQTIPKIVYTNRKAQDILKKLKQDKRINLVLEKDNVRYDEFAKLLINQINNR